MFTAAQVHRPSVPTGPLCQETLPDAAIHWKDYNATVVL
jgi:hypothetical protein